MKKKNSKKLNSLACYAQMLVYTGEITFILFFFKKRHNNKQAIFGRDNSANIMIFMLLN